MDSGFLIEVDRPIALKKGTDNQIDEALTANPYPTWKKLEEMVDKGKIRNIGVSKCVCVSRFWLVRVLRAY